MDIWDALTVWSGTTMDREYFESSFNVYSMTCLLSLLLVNFKRD